jgi:hypothetical protein
MNISTQRELRICFWSAHPNLKRRGRAKQASYPTDVRVAWRDFVEKMRRSGDLTERLAQKSTL